MKVHPDCVPCLMKRVLFQSRLVDNGREMDSIEAALKEYSASFCRGSNSAELATKVHAKSYEALGVDDPYLELKVRADEIAETYLDKVQAFVDSSEDRFAAAVRVSIIGNIMDFGSGIAIDDPEDFHREFEKLLEQGIDLDDTKVLKDLIMKSQTVIYCFDNCGESQFDKILIRQIRSMGKRVVAVARGKEILNDVAVSDALRIGMDKEVDRLLDTNAFAIGVDMSKIGDDLRDEIAHAGVMITKGMANFESLSDEIMTIPVAYLMRIKCIPVAESVGASLGMNVVRIQPAGEKGIKS